MNSSSKRPPNSLMSSRARGFTLVELMIVVAIIGILAAIALPTYRRYITNARMVEVLNQMTGDKSRVSYYRGETQTWPDAGEVHISGPGDSPFLSAPTTFLPVGGLPEERVLTYSVDIKGMTGTMTLTSTTSTGSATWTCASPDIHISLLPKNCR